MPPRTREAYDVAFAREAAVAYPQIDALEARFGHCVASARLLEVARVLACPLKVNPPNWQHGRVLYSLVRNLWARDPSPGVFLDIGTAKGFSAVMIGDALQDAGSDQYVMSVDIVDPFDRVPRNSVAELDSLKTVPEFVEPFLRYRNTTFYGGGSQQRLDDLRNQRCRFAFVDGKHNEVVVGNEIEALRRLQQPGDMVLFDDAQIVGVSRAIRTIAARWYHLEPVPVNEQRSYVIATKQ